MYSHMVTNIYWNLVKYSHMGHKISVALLGSYCPFEAQFEGT
jgi:hypothetical protein